MIIRKSDGGFGYDATDMASIRYRVDELKADRLIYVTDIRQAPHFGMVFAAARRAGYVPAEVLTEHVGFGMVLGANGKPYKTRDGGTVGLADLLDEAEKLASPEVALGAVKYADLQNQLIKDYVFAVERMVATTGNTGPYLQYAHARTCAIFRNPKAKGLAGDTITVLEEDHEQTLALLLGRFGETVAEVAATLQPHRLCTYLYDVATAYSSFYEHCPVLTSEGDVRESRLALAKLTQRVLGKGLYLLGIAAPEVM
ncbi:Arginine--tRNA ligase [Platysternon megacephalum]|uniref:arginine--tRNA ligase n=1 Tax=Platysternon megacephalum TaxID=55544 RepID=A0A4D9DC30_9SAUR|nr:Arginine--tRNA ligase [Platysternon megacephalum]